jgi:sodium-dependent dicarboxylate transporter 2/3/5
LKEICILFFGGLTIASAIELVNLHKRIALSVLIRFGSNPKWLMLGFMIVTAFLSFWISNTACTAMMLPVVTAVVNQLNAHASETKEKNDEPSILK